MNPEAIRKHIQELVGNAHDYKNVLPQVLKVVIDHELWRRLSRADGRPFDTLGDFLVTHFPHGGSVGQDRNCLTYSQVMKLCEDFPSVVDVLAKHAPRGKPGRKKAVEEIADVRQQLNRHKGDTVPVLQAKLAEHHPGIWADFIAGKFGSVRAAAEAAGLVKNANDPLARLKSNWKKASPGQRAEFLAFIRADQEGGHGRAGD